MLTTSPPMLNMWLNLRGYLPTHIAFDAETLSHSVVCQHAIREGTALGANYAHVYRIPTMSNPPSNAVVPSGGGNQAFQQQGSLDWVALGNMQYSMSIAVLGHLSKAGIEPLTIAFRQAMCSSMPIGAHGEKVLADAMSKLTAKSFAADLLWFGIGVRHILRDLVLTSQGCSLIALCAALAEGHTIDVSALVMYEVAKESGGPRDLTPSLEQWKALVRTSAAIFVGTNFGLRVHQIARLGMVKPLSDIDGDDPHPSDLAKVVLSIGQVAQGNLQSISVTGDFYCSWIVAWADFVLGLRVCVRDVQGNDVYSNYNRENTFAQVTVNFLENNSKNNSLAIQTSHLVRSGIDFVGECLGYLRTPLFSLGRLPWESMFFDTFGHSFTTLVKQDEQRSTTPLQSLPIIVDASAPQTGFQPVNTANQVFVRVLAIIILEFAARYSASSTGTAKPLLLRMCTHIPELRPCQDQILCAISEVSKEYGPEDTLFDCSMARNISPKHKTLEDELSRQRMELEELCQCPSHRSKNKIGLENFCLVTITGIVVKVGFMLRRVILDTPLLPAVLGLHRLLSAQPDIKFRPLKEDPEGIMENIAILFSGESWRADRRGRIAHSDGRVYCYTHTLAELTDDLQVAEQIHVGLGQIQYRTQVYQSLHDDIRIGKDLANYPARYTHAETLHNQLTQDTSSSSITSQLLVEELPTFLGISHQVTSDSGRVLIGPSAFLENLWLANCYKYYEKLPKSPKVEWESVLHDKEVIVVYGEGRFQASDTCHTIRPHRGNRLGRCVAIWISALHGTRTALVTTDEEVELFARFWAKHNIDRIASGKTPVYYSLIS
ncbi:hypothetical protein T440DRAFT_508506 [Plenodomus tracheiphilus IPT5]|uniref:Uncharacterized protein n=1 Tax=Plenodomus tracheiphilus IPT5 TaxID=1408161 RepID=A0A6A7B5S5_9PLEO|nr:hypothetical protein T440DRAFT_508506 [Plenodomus tracheiphilus IPT5]